MIKHWTLLACTLWTASAAADPAEPERLTPADFASALELQVQPELAVQTLLVPLEVYRGTRAQLADLSVFDPEGNAVPIALHSLSPELKQQVEEREVPLFPIYQLPGEDPWGDVLQIERAADGSVAKISVPLTKRAAREARLAAYVLDVSKLEHPISGLRLELAPTQGSVTTPISVEASDDLSSWRSRAADVVVGRLRHQGQSIERQVVAIDPGRAAFLRLRWPGEMPPLPLHKAFATFETEQLDRDVPRARFESAPVAPKHGSYALDLGAALALDEVLPSLPDNTLIRATLALRAEPSATGSQVFEGSLYRLRHDGLELASPPVELAGQRARYLTLRVDPRSAGLGERALSFEVRYLPDQLLFVSRAPGTYLLAYGSYKSVPAPFSAAQLLDFMPAQARASLPLASAKVVGQRALGGPSQRALPPAPPSYRLPILWAVLVAGALTLLLLALRLLRGTGSSQ